MTNDRAEEIVRHPAHNVFVVGADEKRPRVHRIVGLSAQAQLVAGSNLFDGSGCSVVVADATGKEHGGEIAAVGTARFGEDLDAFVGYQAPLVADHHLERVGLHAQGQLLHEVAVIGTPAGHLANSKRGKKLLALIDPVQVTETGQQREALRLPHLFGHLQIHEPK